MENINEKLNQLAPDRRRKTQEVKELSANKVSEAGILYLTLSLFIFITPWLMGIALARGIVQTLTTIFIPPYSWYLVVEKLMWINGMM